MGHANANCDGYKNYDEFTVDDRATWREGVQKAIARGDLRWPPKPNKNWILSGICPNCGCHMAQEFFTHVEEIKEVDQDGVSGLEILCSCYGSGDPERRGCGYGLRIKVPIGPPW